MARTPLISGDELVRRLDGTRATLGTLRLLDARPGAAGREAYQRAHIPSAVYVDLDRDLAAVGADPKTGGRHPLPDVEVWARRLGELGIGPEDNVVVYDDQSGAFAAARCWWMLRSLGHREVSVLDGGLEAATAAGIPLSATAQTAPAKPPYPSKHFELPAVDLAFVDAVRSGLDFRVVDVRSSERYRGDVEPLDPIAGHIPGAVNIPFSNNLDLEGRFRSPEELRALYLTALAPLPPDRWIVHCGSGVTACHTLLALEHASLAGARLYVGSWSEWCRTDKPRATGETP